MSRRLHELLRGIIARKVPSRREYKQAARVLMGTATLSIGALIWTISSAELDGHDEDKNEAAWAEMVVKYPSLAMQPKLPSLLVVGDSISLGYGSHLKDAIKSTFNYQRKRGKDPSDTSLCGANGGDSWDVLRYLKHVAEGGKDQDVDFVLLNCGLHDIKRVTLAGGGDCPQVPLKTYAENVRDIIRTVKDELGATPIWVRTTPVVDEIHNSYSCSGRQFRRYAADVASYNEAADAVCAEQDIAVIDLHALTTALGPGVFRDHVHYTQAVEATQGRYIAQALRAATGDGNDGNQRCITEEQWAHFLREGWVVLPRSQIFQSDDEFEALQERIDDIQLGIADVPYEKMMMQLDSTTGRYEDSGAQTLGSKGPSLRYRKIQNLENDPVIMNYLRRPLFREACYRVYGGTTPISSFRTMFFNKPAQRSRHGSAGGTALPWHQDRWKFLDRDPILNVYLALDWATPESGCVQILPRSHELGVVNPEHHSAFLTPEQAEEICEGNDDVIDLVLHPGEVALMHNWVIHSSGVNSTPNSRRALSVSFMDARSQLRRENFEQFLGKELKTTGYPEGGTSFPVIFKAADSASE